MTVGPDAEDGGQSRGQGGGLDTDSLAAVLVTQSRGVHLRLRISSARATFQVTAAGKAGN